ncbi:hypothetical protein BDN70DRAFT_899268 [Pholiota conissans]|uniref:Uncharacterized protein n=1 Tax=Pholiota conissans TaxID=109636 RepID=A0A9P5YQL0_9AGAR|nr:hypothetical protein BDN70DRAFT_899268 [Pholiota conissans]
MEIEALDWKKNTEAPHVSYLRSKEVRPCKIEAASGPRVHVRVPVDGRWGAGMKYMGANFQGNGLGRDACYKLNNRGPWIGIWVWWSEVPWREGKECGGEGDVLLLDGTTGERASGMEVQACVGAGTVTLWVRTKKESRRGMHAGSEVTVMKTASVELRGIDGEETRQAQRTRTWDDAYQPG